ncbi:mechanosensitive ion channel family protein [Frankia sp. ACN1ag]|uniref:mechanosensitive ion channel family protein n=1 Tax=Frankia sp. ACN1ag TaxID=102891 RepID=UPI0006DC2557|nr:hypothetical protein [Frankia sp. ACN1ag]KQC40275.1 hypothetical protein UK82_01250 [Frankia sp. ACN1ag]
MQVTVAIAWDRGFSDAWSRIAETGPKIGVFLAICLFGGLLVRAGARLLTALATRLGVDGVLDRGGLPALLRRPAADVRTGAVRMLTGLGLLAVLRVAVGVFGPSAAEDTVTDLLALLLHTMLAAVIIAIGVGLARLARTFVREALRELSYARAAGNTVAAVLVIAFGKAGLDEVGIATSVTTPVLWAVLATLTGVIVVGVGGGLVRPMQLRWEEILEHAEDTAAQARLTWRARHPDPHPADPHPADPGPGAVDPGDPNPSDPNPGDPDPGDPDPGDPDLIGADPADVRPADGEGSYVDTAGPGGSGPGLAELAADPDVPVEPDPTAGPVTPSIPAPASGAVAATAPRPSIPPPSEQVPFEPAAPDRTSASASPPRLNDPSRPADRPRPEGPP